MDLLARKTDRSARAREAASSSRGDGAGDGSDEETRRSSARARLFDGAVGTELISLGLDLRVEPTEAWTLSHPDRLAALHRRYVQAGAEVVQTNTFGANRPRLVGGKRPELAHELGRLNREAVALARASGARAVAASLGPTGIDPFSSQAAARMAAAYEEQLQHLVAAGVDALHFETMYHPIEAVAAIAAARRIAPRLPLIVSATVALGDHGFQTPLGVPLERMAQAVLDAGPDAVGLNCSLEARKMLGALRLLRDLTELPILVKPQGGQPAVGCRGDSRGDPPDRFARDVAKLVDEGADLVGGCCGAGPDHIAALARALAAEAATAPSSFAG